MEGAEDNLQTVRESILLFMAEITLVLTFIGSFLSFSYASLYFLVCVDPGDNELVTLEVIHHFVEVLDRYFGNVCELDLIFNFHKVRIDV